MHCSIESKETGSTMETGDPSSEPVEVFCVSLESVNHFDGECESIQWQRERISEVL